VGRYSSVGITIRYGLDGQRIESRWGRSFPQPSRPALGPTQPPLQWAPSLFPEDKATRVWRWPPTTSSAEVKGGVELCRFFFFFFFFFYWDPVANAPGSTAAWRRIVRAQILKFPLVPPGAPTPTMRETSSRERGNYGRKCPVNFAVKEGVLRYLKGSFICHKSATWDRRLYFPSEGRHAEDFFALKNSTALPGFEPANP
jgi:hypothetical protein